MKKQDVEEGMLLRTAGGEWAGIAGEVIAVGDESALLRVAGNFNGKPIDDDIEVDLAVLEQLAR